MTWPEWILAAALLRYVIGEVDHLFTVWDFVHVRRQALKRLWAALPDEDYYAGILPPHVPFWRSLTQFDTLWAVSTRYPYTKEHQDSSNAFPQVVAA